MTQTKDKTRPPAQPPDGPPDPAKKRYRRRPGSRLVEGEDDLVGVQWVLDKTGWSIDTLNRRLAAGDYPQPIEGKSGRDRKWVRKQHTRWTERRMAEVAKTA